MALAALPAGAPAHGAAPLSVEHTPVTEAVPGAGVEVTARVRGEARVRTVTLYVRAGANRAYYAIPMTRRGLEYWAEIPAAFTSPGTLEYYVEAIDAAGNKATAPAEDAADSPYSIAITGGLGGEFMHLPRERDGRGPFALGAALVTRLGAGPAYDLELDASWGPVRASARVASDETSPPGVPAAGEPGAGSQGTPNTSFVLILNTRAVEAQVGDVKASISPLTAQEYEHRGYYVRLDLGEVEAALSSGYVVSGEDGRQARRFFGARGAIGSPFAKLGASAVAVVDLEATGVSADPEQNYVFSSDLGLRLPGLKAQLEAATSLYFPNARGSFWEAGEQAGIPSDAEHQEYLEQLARLFWSLPKAARRYIVPPHPRHWKSGNPLVDAAVEFRLASALPWTRFSARAFRSGPEFRTLAASAEADKEGYAASLRVGPQSGLVQLEAEVERYRDGVQPLLSLLAGEPPIPWEERNEYHSARGRLNVSFGGPVATLSLERSAANPDRSLPDLAEGAPKNDTLSHGVELSNVPFPLGRYSANLRMGFFRSAFADAANPESSKATTTHLLGVELARGALRYEVLHILRQEVDASGVASSTPSLTLGLGWRKNGVPLGPYTFHSVEVEGRSTYSHTWGDGVEKSTDSYRIRLLVDTSDRFQLGAQFLSVAFSDRNTMETTRRSELSFGCLLRF